MSDICVTAARTNIISVYLTHSRVQVVHDKIRDNTINRGLLTLNVQLNGFCKGWNVIINHLIYIT